MQYETAVKCLYNPTIGRKYSLHLKAEDGSLECAIPFWSGTFNYVMTEFLRGVDWPSICDKAFELCGSLQAIRTIELNDYHISHLTRFRVPPVSSPMESSAKATLANAPRTLYQWI
jgi:hypothetical protein